MEMAPARYSPAGATLFSGSRLLERVRDEILVARIYGLQTVHSDVNRVGELAAVKVVVDDTFATAKTEAGVAMVTVPVLI